MDNPMDSICTICKVKLGSQVNYCTENGKKNGKISVSSNNNCFTTSLNTPSYLHLNLAASTMCQWTPVALQITVWKCDKSALQTSEPQRERLGKQEECRKIHPKWKQNRETMRDFLNLMRRKLDIAWRIEMKIQKSNSVNLFLSFVHLPLTFPSFVTVQKWIVIFLCCHQPPSEPLSGTRAVILLSYYISNGGVFVQSVAFTQGLRGCVKSAQ